MPDHIHTLLELGTRLTLTQVTNKLKNAVRATAPEIIVWQENFFDTRVRRPEENEQFAFYLFMNPYCAGLIPASEHWPGWYRMSARQWNFETKLLAGGLPPPEWIAEANRFAAMLPVGAD